MEAVLHTFKASVHTVFTHEFGDRVVQYVNDLFGPPEKPVQLKRSAPAATVRRPRTSSMHLLATRNSIDDDNASDVRVCSMDGIGPYCCSAVTPSQHSSSRKHVPNFTTCAPHSSPNVSNDA